MSQEKVSTNDVKEFVSANTTSKNVAAKEVQNPQVVAKNLLQNCIERMDAQPLAALGVYAVIALLVILISIMGCNIPIVPVCVVVIIETLMAACLHNLPVWLHLSVMILEVIVGVIYKKIAFLVLGAFLYLAAIYVLQIMMKDED